MTDAVTGNGTYSVAGINDLPGDDGNGASLVVIWQDPSLAQVGQVQVYDGASVAYINADVDETITERR